MRVFSQTDCTIFMNLTQRTKLAFWQHSAQKLAFWKEMSCIKICVDFCFTQFFIFSIKCLINSRGRCRTNGQTLF